MSQQGKTTVPRSTLGHTGLEISKISVGTWGFGGTSPQEAQIGEDENLVAVMQAAFAAGINCFDSAEERLGRLLKHVDLPDDLVVVTKFGHGKGFSADQFRASAEQSLKDLDIEKIDLMMIHDPRTAADMDIIFGRGGALEGLRQLQEDGLIGFTGVATGTLTPLQIAVDSGEFDVIQFPRLLTVINRAAETSGLLAGAKEKDMGTLAAAPFAGNILATGVRGVERPLYGYRPALPEIVEAVTKMQARADELGLTMAQASLQYVVTHPQINAAVLGVTKPEELQWNIDALSAPASRQDLESVADLGAIDSYYIGGPEFVTSYPREPR
jgi:D-threo-aldose 1-dehydrogenase